MDETWGWAGSAEEYLGTDPTTLLGALEAHYRRCNNEAPDDSHRRAWVGSIRVMQDALRLLSFQDAAVCAWSVVHEYELPRERGRRPDVVVLANGVVIVLEFKEHDTPLSAHVDQVEAYARDLSEYHRASHGRVVCPILVPTKYRGEDLRAGDTVITGASGVATAVYEAAQSEGDVEPLELTQWLTAEYAPLPSLVAAARLIFEHERLPHIRRAESAGIPETLEALERIADRAVAQRESHLALITGVPGAGKTLVGLQFVYSSHFTKDNDGQQAVFLSGNGPLVKVLQHTLKSRVFVQDVLGFLREYGAVKGRMPREHIWVFDEAQRAFDAEMAAEKQGAAVSEPENFLRLGERLDSWALMVGLIGEGQEINRGEEAGIQQWNDALGVMSRPWTVHCPAALAPVFTNATHIHTDHHLNLNTSLRSHRAEDVHLWVALLLDGRLDECKRLSYGLIEQGFEMYVTRDIEAARLYVRERYAGLPDARFGLLASAKAKNLGQYGFLNEFNYTRNLRVGPWFADDPSSHYSCCALRDTATEFQCQGLELDMPIIGWGQDLWWTGSQWDCNSARSKPKNPRQIRLNAYRVLLTRGRDGFIVFVPPEPQFNRVNDALVSAGCVTLARTWLR